MNPRDIEDIVYEHDKAIATIEAWIKGREKLSDKAVLDLEELKLRDRESQVTQRLTYALGGFAGTLIITLIIFIATHA